MSDPSSEQRRQQLQLAMQHHLAGRMDEAGEIYQQLHQASPDDPEILYLLGLLCCDLGIHDTACNFLEQALRLDPEFREAQQQLLTARTGLAHLHLDGGRLSEAARCLDQVLAADPAHRPGRLARGRLALQQGDAVAAERLLVAALEPSLDADGWNWLGLARLLQGHYAAAEGALVHALQLNPELKQPRNNLGLVLFHQERFEEAARCFTAVLDRDPADFAARINLANTRRLQGQPDEALVVLEGCVEEQPDSVEVLNNLGTTHQDLGNPEAALSCLERAHALAPESAEVRWNLALSQLALGDFTRGWPSFEARWEGCASLRGAYRLPRDRAWQGEDLNGRRVLLWAEQGFGDTLQFVRFARDVAGRGAIVTLAVPRELLRLLARVEGVTRTVVLDGALPEFDLHLPLMSLPGLLGLRPELADLQGDRPYLHADPALVAAWQQRLAGERGMRVGLVWAGRSRSESPALALIDSRRSVPLQQLAPLLEVEGCSFYSLQKGDSPRKSPSGASSPSGPAGLARLQDHSAEWSDFADTAAFITQLDLVISVDTAVAHLAGALGKPVWLLNRHDSCWRWLHRRDDSPWYSGLRQFRQPRRGDWDTPLAAVLAALRAAAHRD